MHIGLDIMGGDFAPAAALEGLALACREVGDDIGLTLIGESQIIRDFLAKKGLPESRFNIVHTSQVIEMGESPTKAIGKQDTSIMTGLRMLKTGEIDAFLSAGNTGAVYVGALYTVKAIEGVLRPAMPSLVPKEHGGLGLILDVGANADCKPDVLLQFGVLGAIYCKSILGISNPKVGLLNIGSEPEKGNILTQAAYPMFVASDRFDFIGNVEGYDLFSDKVDVIVCDGFTGNVLLKTAETIIEIVKKRKGSDEFLDRFDYQNYGGLPILGVNKPVIIGHGVSSPEAFSQMIQLGVQLVNSNMIEKIKQAAMEPSNIQ